METINHLKPSLVGKMLGRYHYVGFPILIDSFETTDTKKLDHLDLELFNNLYELNIPSDIIPIIYKYTNIHQMYAIGKYKSFHVFININVDAEKPFAWILFDNKWYKYYLQQCTVRYSTNKNRVFYGQCKNIVISPGNGKESIYSKNVHGCCISHVATRPRYHIQGDNNFSCRACCECIKTFWTKYEIQDVTNEAWKRQECCVINQDIYSPPIYIFSVGNTNLYDNLVKTGMNFNKYEFLTNGKITYSRSNKFYKSILYEKLDIFGRKNKSVNN